MIILYLWKKHIRFFLVPYHYDHILKEKHILFIFEIIQNSVDSNGDRCIFEFLKERLNRNRSKH